MPTEASKTSCFAVIGSLTQAMRAQHVLSDAAVFSNVEKADPTLTRRGCAYGVRYPCSREEELQAVLRRAGIRIKATVRDPMP